jgi:hypothetical protein
MSRRYIRIAEAAEYLKISDRTVRRLIADGAPFGPSRPLQGRTREGHCCIARNGGFSQTLLDVYIGSAIGHYCPDAAGKMPAIATGPALRPVVGSMSTHCRTVVV